MRNNSFTIIRKELLCAFRDQTITLIMVFTWILLLSSSIMTGVTWSHDRENESAANALFRKQWEQQQANPHEAAHFGTYLFKPVNLLSFFDQGLNDYFGTSYRIEAHKQNEVDYGKAANSDAIMRFGPFTLALILQLLVPLTLLFMASSSVIGEKESGTWKILIAQGVRPARIIWQKVWSNYILMMAVVLPVFVILFIFLVFSHSWWWAGRFFLLTGSYLAYYLFVTIAAVTISAISKNSRAALTGALSVWLLACILLPPILSNVADQQNPLMSRATFKNNVEQGFLKGLSGHDPYYERGDRYYKALLKKYHADSTSQLPVNASGVIMQLNEDYQNQVFDHYYDQVQNKFNQQQSFLSNASLLNPFLALKRISMTTSGTDFYHHADFFNKARRYRNGFIRQLNMAVAEHPLKDNINYKAEPTFFKGIRDFKYQLPGMNKVLEWQVQALLSLLLWVVVMSFVLQLIAKRS